ncbi:hypothetical protein [Actinomadura gamaensis]|uniref:Uncharacterized protein n=1 Tax=Actinomadura gamaensis TaxID=1763541 RepID=A0ABV9U920_9ACTN
MDRRRSSGDSGPNWPLLAGIAAALAVAVAAVLAPRRHFPAVGHLPVPVRGGGPAPPLRLREGGSAPRARGRSARTARLRGAKPERAGRSEARSDEAAGQKRSALKFAINWPLAVGIAATLFLVWLWWWSATRGGPG